MYFDLYRTVKNQNIWRLFRHIQEKILYKLSYCKGLAIHMKMGVLLITDVFFLQKNVYRPQTNAQSVTGVIPVT